MTRDFSFLLAVKTLDRSRMNVVKVLGLQTGYVDPRPHWIVPPIPPSPHYSVNIKGIFQCASHTMLSLSHYLYTQTHTHKYTVTNSVLGKYPNVVLRTGRL